MKTSDKQWKFLTDIATLIMYARGRGYKLTGGELYRTKYQQEKYVEEGKSQTMNSKHLKRLAMDFNLFSAGGVPVWEITDEWKDLGRFWESLDDKNEWGGNWKFLDLPHFQRND